MGQERHLDRETDEQLKDSADRRQIAKEIVLQGAMLDYTLALQKLFERG